MAVSALSHLQNRMVATFWLLLAVGALPVQAEPLMLSTGTAAPYAYEDGTGFLNRLIKEAFRRVGVEAGVEIHVASERSLINANNGTDDGLAMRIKGLEKEYPNMIMIPEKVISNEFIAFTRKESKLKSAEPQELAHSQLGYITGWKVYDRQFPNRPDIQQVRDAEQLYNLLLLKRIDVALHEKWQGLLRVKHENLPVRPIYPVLASNDMYMYLHKKHADLVPKVTEALREMKRDGTYKAIFDATLGQLER